jgi:hypothetical protein
MHTNSRIPDLLNDSFFAMNRWFYKLYRANLLFNLDDAANLIVDDAGNAIFTDEECNRLNTAVERMFAAHGELVYDVGLKYFHKALLIPQA